MVALIKSLIRKGNVRRMSVIHQQRRLIELPVPLGSPMAPTGSMVSPVLAALAAFGEQVAECAIEVEKTEE